MPSPPRGDARVPISCPDMHVGRSRPRQLFVLGNAVISVRAAAVDQRGRPQRTPLASILRRGRRHPLPRGSRRYLRKTVVGCDQEDLLVPSYVPAQDDLLLANYRELRRGASLGGVRAQRQYEKHPHAPETCARNHVHRLSVASKRRVRSRAFVCRGNAP